MKIIADTPDQYIEQLEDEKRQAVTYLRNTILDHLPKGYVETISYGMIGYVVPHELYPKGYHVDPKLPLPLANLAAQKNHIALYHMALYGDKEMMKWFKESYEEKADHKLDMGKSCIRFKPNQNIPYELIGELMEKVSVKEWIDSYNAFRKKYGK